MEKQNIQRASVQNIEWQELKKQLLIRLELEEKNNVFWCRIQQETISNGKFARFFSMVDWYYLVLVRILTTKREIEDENWIWWTSWHTWMVSLLQLSNPTDALDASNEG